MNRGGSQQFADTLFQQGKIRLGRTHGVQLGLLRRLAFSQHRDPFWHPDLPV